MVKFRLKWSRELHDTMHGFRAGQGTGTETLEEKLAQQLARIDHEPLFKVFWMYKNCTALWIGIYAKRETLWIGDSVWRLCEGMV